MARNKVLQITVNSALEDRVEQHRQEKDFGSTSEAGKDALEFAFRILDNKDKNEAVSNRILIEEMYRLIHRVEYLQRYIHTQTFTEKMPHHEQAKSTREKVYFQVDNLSQAFIDGDE